MRPRKKILLWGEDEDQASQLAFVLNIQPYFAVTKCTAAEFTRALTATADLSLAILLDNGNRKLTRTFASLTRGICPVLIVAKAKGEPINSIDTLAVLPYGASNAELLERVRILSVRKRGPKAAIKRLMPTETVMTNYMRGVA